MLVRSDRILLALLTLGTVATDNVPVAATPSSDLMKVHIGRQQNSQNQADASSNDCSTRALIQTQLSLALTRHKMSIVAAEHRLLSLLDSKLTAMEAKRAQEIQASVLTVSNKVDIAVSVVEQRMMTLLENKMAAFEARLTGRWTTDTPDATVTPAVRLRPQSDDRPKVSSSGQNSAKQKGSNIEEKVEQELESMKTIIQNYKKDQTISLQKLAGDIKAEIFSEVRTALARSQSHRNESEDTLLEVEGRLDRTETKQSALSNAMRIVNNTVTKLVGWLQSSKEQNVELYLRSAQLNNTVSTVASRLEAVEERCSSAIDAGNTLRKNMVLNEEKQDDDIQNLQERQRAFETNLSNMSSKIATFTTSLKESISYLYSQKYLKESHFRETIKSLQAELVKMNEKWETVRQALLLKHDTDIEELLSRYNDTVSEFQSHVQDSEQQHDAAVQIMRQHENETKQHIQQHINDLRLSHQTDLREEELRRNESMSDILSYLNSVVTTLNKQTNEVLSLLSSEDFHPLEEIKSILSNLTAELETQQRLSLQHQLGHESSLSRVTERLNQTIAELRARLDASNVAQTEQIQQLTAALGNLSAVMKQKEGSRVKTASPDPTSHTSLPLTYPPIPPLTYPPIPPESLTTTAFFAALTNNVSRTRKLRLPEVYDVGGLYSQSTGLFSPPSTGGLFFHSLSASSLPNVGINFNLRTANRYFVDVYRSSGLPGVDMTSRDVISSKTGLYLNTDKSLFSNRLRQTSWTCIGISDSMKRVVAFSLGRSSSLIYSTDQLAFDTNISSLGGGVSLGRNSFTAPHAGIYLFSLSIGAKNRRPFQVALMRGSSELFHFARKSTAHSGTDTVTRVAIVQLSAGDKVFVKVYGYNTAIYSDGEFQTSLSGFLYDPLHKAPVAWSLGKNTSYINTAAINITLGFEQIVVDQGSAWNETARAIVAPLPGYYYIHVSAGALPRKPVHLFVTVNGQPRVDLWRATGYQNDVDLLSRSALLKLQAGDKVQIITADGTGIFSNAGLQTSFGGLLIYREG